VKRHIDGEDVEVPKDQEADFLAGIPQPAEPDYKYLRLLEYALIQDQLDMIYWDKVNDTTKWQDHIASVKAKYPKPE
jgi:hypothetical protein